MPVISQRRMQDRAEAILEAAKQVFASKGFEAASIAEIARAAEVSDGLIYRYYENKRDLVYHVLRVFYERLLIDIESEVARATCFRDRLRNLIRRHIEAFVADTDLCRLFIAEMRVARDYHGSAIQDLNRRYTSVLVKVVDEAVAAGEVRREVNPRLVRDVIFGAVEHLAWRHVNRGGGLDIDAIAEQLTALIAGGVCTAEGLAR